MENTQFIRPKYFNLRNDGDTAVVRILHSSTTTIESQLTHRIQLGEKTKRIKCTLQGCPLCAQGNPQENRIYIHLWNYDTSEEQIWDRTDKILPNLMVIERDWKPLYTAVVRITRKGNEFPTYEVTALNPMQYDNAENYKNLIDKPFSKSMSLSRKNEEITEFLSTGKFPEKKKFIPKEEYLKNKQQTSNQESYQPASQPTYSQPGQSYKQDQSYQPAPGPYSNPTSFQPSQITTEMDDYFDPFSAPTKVTRV